MALNNDKAQQTLKKRLKEESSDVIRENIILFLKKLGMEAFTKKEALEAVQIAKDKKKLNKPVKRYVLEKDLPDLFWKDGKKVDLETIRFLFVKQKNKEKDYFRPSEETLPLLKDIDKTKSGPFAKALLDTCLQNGAIKAVNKPFLAFVTALGD